MPLKICMFCDKEIINEDWGWNGKEYWHFDCIMECMSKRLGAENDIQKRKDH